MRFRHRKQWFTLAGLVGVLALCAIAWHLLIAAGERRIRSLIETAEQKLGMPIDIREMSLGFGYALFDDIALGKDQVAVLSRVRADANLNPFTGRLGQIEKLTVHQITIKTSGKALLDGLSSPSLATLLELATKPSESGEKVRSEALTQTSLLLPARLQLKSGTVVVVDSDGKPLVVWTGLGLTLDRNAKAMAFKAAQVAFADGSSEQNLSGSIRPERPEGGYEFILRRRKSENALGWTARGRLNDARDQLEVSLNAKSIPQIFTGKLAQIFPNQGQSAIDANIHLRRDPNGHGYYFAGEMDVKHVYVEHPRLSAQVVGPVALHFKANGSFDSQSGDVSVDSGLLSFPQESSDPAQDLETPAPDETATIAFSLTGDLKPQPGRKSLWQVLARINQTSCQAFLAAIPRGFAPALEGFQLSGNIGAGLEVTIDPDDPENFASKVSDSRFDCQVQKVPFPYSRDYLGSAFSLKREGSEGEAPLEILLGPESSVFTPLAKIGQNAVTAIVAAEDAGFFQHDGIDPFAIQQAMRRNLAEKRIAIGGSTITMQTAKNLFLSRERTFARKAQEMFLAWHLDKILPKDRILELYFNIIEFGPGLFGITQAARHHFNKHPFDLTLKEATYLASVLPSPVSRYHNFCAGHLSPGYEDLVNTLLKRMLSLNRISQERYNEALEQPLVFNALQREISPACLASKRQTAQRE